MKYATLSLDLQEEKNISPDGNEYTIFATNIVYDGDEIDPFKQIISLTKNADLPVISLVSTALWDKLTKETRYFKCPWQQAQRWFPEGNKNNDKIIKQAKILYNNLKNVQTPENLPEI